MSSGVETPHSYTNCYNYISILLPEFSAHQCLLVGIFSGLFGSSANDGCLCRTTDAARVRMCAVKPQMTYFLPSDSQSKNWTGIVFPIQSLCLVVRLSSFRNISRGASKMSCTSALFKTGLNRALSERMPITGVTSRPFCKTKTTA